MNDIITHYKERGEVNRQYLHLPPKLLQQRTAAQEQWIEQGFPSQKAENWKYTSLRTLDKTYFTSYPTPTHEEDEDCTPHLIKEAYIACFHNGYFCKKNSNLDNLPKGVIIAPMSTALLTHQALIERYCGQSLQSKKQSIIPFNENLWQEGLFIFIPKQVSLETTIQLLHINDSKTTHCSTHLHHLILLEDQAQVNLLEEYNNRGETTQKNLTTVVTEIYLGENSTFTHIRSQNKDQGHILLTHTEVQQTYGSEYNHHSYDVGAALNRNDLAIHLIGEQAQCHLQGLYHVNNKQHVDNHISVHHQAPNTRSTQHYRGILDNQGQAVFNGAINVTPEATGTNAQQYNHNILLSDKAEIDTKPELEIYTNDIQCSHGATIGQLSEEALFYLQTRGISKAQAREILLTAFIHTIVEKLPSMTIKNKLVTILQKKFSYVDLEVQHD